MVQKEYIRRLTDKDRVRCEIAISKGEVVKFLVQYEAFINNKWQAIARYDTKHDYVHLDLISQDGSTKKKWFYHMGFNEGLNYAYEDIGDNWEMYKEKYIIGDN